MATQPLNLQTGMRKLNPFALLGVFGIGAGVMHIISMLAGSEPKAVIEVISSWGPSFVFAMLALWIVDRRSGEMVSSARDNAKALQQMADATQQIAQRDDVRAREMELIVGHLSRNSEKSLEHLMELKEELAQIKLKVTQ